MAVEKLLRIAAVEAAVGYKRSTIYGKIQAGTFPAPIALGERASAWLESEVAGWIQERIRVSRLGAQGDLAAPSEGTPPLNA